MDKKHIFSDVSVVNRYKTGSNHRLLRRTMNICRQERKKAVSVLKERARMMKSIHRLCCPKILSSSELFQLELQNRVDSLETTIDVAEMTDSRRCSSTSRAETSAPQIYEIL